MLRRARRARCASLGFLLLAATVAVHLPCTVRTMTVSGISPNHFGSFGGVRLTVSGSGFGDQRWSQLGGKPIQPLFLKHEGALGALGAFLENYKITFDETGSPLSPATKRSKSPSISD